jgi:deazaflavin-dependent oxidoreductase (nitroreductase family)
MRDPAVSEALEKGGIVDITTYGRRSGEARRIEIVCFAVEGRLYITGLPGRRGWYANVTADPRMTLHLKRGVTADLPARARPVTDPAERRRVLEHATAAWGRSHQIEAFVASSPLIDVLLDDGARDGTGEAAPAA